LYWLRKAEKTIDLQQSHWLYHISFIEYTSPWAGFELTILVVMIADCTGSCKCNYHTITTRITWVHMILTKRTIQFNKYKSYWQIYDKCSLKWWYKYGTIEIYMKFRMSFVQSYSKSESRKLLNMSHTTYHHPRRIIFKIKTRKILPRSSSKTRLMIYTSVATGWEQTLQ